MSSFLKFIALRGKVSNVNYRSISTLGSQLFATKTVQKHDFNRAVSEAEKIVG